MLPQQIDEPSDIKEGKIYAVLAYLSILCIIPLILKKDNEFVLKHGKQGLVIFLGQVAFFIIHILLGIWILKIGMFILGGLSFFGIIHALRGRYVRLPVVSDIADSIYL